jgi:ABC-2 type transport system ATP-binding protein
MVIELRSLTKTYDAAVALRDVSLDLEAGGTYGLLGPNGAGKTTLVEILEGLRPPTSGHVRVLGRDPATEPRALKERIGVQLQTTAVPQDLTVLEVVRLFRSFYRHVLPIDEVLGRVALEDKAGTRVRHLSGGQRQRLALALAMVHDPELYLLDEPTSGLDPEARRGIHEILRDLKRRGRTVLVSSHYLDEIEALADRVIVIRAGEVVADGSPLDLLSRAHGLSTLWLAVDGTLDPTPLVSVGARHRGRDGIHERFDTPDPTAAVLALGDLLRAQGLTLVDIRMKRPTLEDVYLELVGGKEAA